MQGRAHGAQKIDRASTSYGAMRGARGDDERLARLAVAMHGSLVHSGRSGGGIGLM